MALNLKRNYFCRSLYTISRSYCEKSIYQRDEEGRQPRMVHGKLYPDWRKPWIHREGEWYSKLSVFVEKNPSPDVLNAMSKIPDLNFKIVKEWWATMKVAQEIHNQKYIPERVAALGSNLAALHYFTYRTAAVRLKDSKEWITGDAMAIELPDHYVDGYIVEAVDCTNFHHGGIRYEGVQNLFGLYYLKWLSLKNNKHIDIWCLDRIAGQNGQTLEFLDISGCKLCIGCIYALARMPALKFLIITDPGDNIDLQSAISMLEQERPKLLIKAVDKE